MNNKNNPYAMTIITSKAKKHSCKDKVTSADVKFIISAIEEHNHLVESHHSCLWENSMDAEKARGLLVQDSIIKLSKYGTKIDGKDFVFLEFKMKERADFTEEYFKDKKQKNSKSITNRTTKLIEKIRRICQLPPDSDEMEYTLAMESKA